MLTDSVSMEYRETPLYLFYVVELYSFHNIPDFASMKYQ